MRRAQQAAMELRDIFERTLRLMNKISRDLTMLSGPTFQQFLGYPIEPAASSSPTNARPTESWKGPAPLCYLIIIFARLYELHRR
jgi:hypothetical protein